MSAFVLGLFARYTEITWGLGVGVWGLGFGGWGLGVGDGRLEVD